MLNIKLDVLTRCKINIQNNFYKQKTVSFSHVVMLVISSATEVGIEHNIIRTCWVRICTSFLKEKLKKLG